MQQVTPKVLMTELAQAILSGIPVMIWGKPGVGKSEIVETVAQSINYNTVEVRVNLMEPVDFRGIPYVEDGKTKWAIPDFLPDAEIHGERGVFKLDELPAGMPATQACMYQIVQDGKLGEYTMPPGWTTVAMGNSLSDRAATFDMPSPLKNKFSHYELIADVGDWCDYAYKRGVDPDLISLVKLKPELLSTFEPDAIAFSTPRTIMMLDKRLKLGKLSTEGRFATISGIVGEGFATEYAAWLRLKAELPDLDAAIANPHLFKKPAESDIAYAVVSSLVDKAEYSVMGGIMKMISKLDREFQVTYVKMLVGQQKVRGNDGKKNPLTHDAVRNWMQDPENAALIAG